MFEVGDIITAVQNEGGGYEYGVTAGNWVGQVIRIENGLREIIRVETIAPRTDEPFADRPGDRYTVHAKYFWVGQVKSVERNTIACVTVCHMDGTPVSASSRREEVFWGLEKEHFEVI